MAAWQVSRHHDSEQPPASEAARGCALWALVCMCVLVAHPGRAIAQESPAPQSTLMPRQALELLGVPPQVQVPDAPPQDGAGQALILSEFVAEASTYSLEVLSSDRSVASSRSSVQVSRRQLGPRLDVSHSRGRGQLATITSPDSPYFPRRDFTVTLRQPLFNFPAYVEVQRKNHVLKSSEADRDSTELRVASESIATFFELTRNSAVIAFSADYEKSLTTLLDHMKARTEGGAASPADLDRVAARVENAKAKLAEATGSYRASLATLKRQVGRIPDSLAIPVDLVISLPSNSKLAYEEAVQSNIELQSARHQLAAIDQEIRAARARFAPRIELEAVRNLNSNGSATTEPTRSEDKRIMLMANLNIFSSGADTAEIASIVSRREALAYRIMHAERKLKEDIEVTYAAVESVSKRVAPAIKEFEANKRVVEAFDQQLFLGGRTLLDVLDAQQKLYESRIYAFQLMTADAQQKFSALRLLGRLAEIRLAGG